MQQKTGGNEENFVILQGIKNCFVMLRVKLSIVLSLIVLTFSPVLSQPDRVSLRDLSQVKVEQLTDSQVGQLINEIERSGMSRSQIEAAALARGMPAAELRKLWTRIDRVRLHQSATVQAGRTREQLTYTETGDLFRVLLESPDTLAEKPGPESRIFGYDLFRNERLTFEPSMNLPTPDNYRLGPGDEVIIDVWGASQQNYRPEVYPDGFIFIENLGPVQVAGLTMKEASERIIRRLRAIYSGLDRNTWAQVSLGHTRSITVHLIGEVNMPGTYTLSSFATVFNALYASGGPTVNGSFRNVEVFRNNRLMATLDVYDFLLKGEQENNIRLEDQDVIRVSPYRVRVDLTGEVKRPGLYEVKPGESLEQAIGFTGGFTDKAYRKKLVVYRKTGTEKKVVNVEGNMLAGFALQDGDSIPVPSILPRFENRVTIRGAVYRPGEYALEDGMTLNNLVGKAEGLRGDAFLPRASVYRLQEDYSLEVIPVDLRKIAENPAADIPLVKDDLVSISSVFDLREEYFVEISGEVNNPGQYPYMENTTLEDLIVMAGGLLESASLSRAEVARRVKADGQEYRDGKIADIHYFTIDQNLQISAEGEAFTLHPFDQVFIRRAPGYEDPQTATVEGEVLYPGDYSLSSKQERISDLLNRAGGLTPEAYPQGARLIRHIPIDREERRQMLETLQAESGDTLLLALDSENEQPIGINLAEILQNPGSSHDLFLEDGDRLVIPKELQTVRLSGAVLNPVTVRYDDHYGFREYISRSGGFAEDARRNRSYVIYANGSIDKTGHFLFFNNYPKVEPGAEIVVPRRPPREKMSTQEVVGLTSTLTSLALVVVTLINRL
ncbi:MAG: SLBB domain-containing protein [Bacteroidales bacterium]